MRRARCLLTHIIALKVGVVDGAPLQSWLAGRAPARIIRRTVEVLTASASAASSSVASTQVQR